MTRRTTFVLAWLAAAITAFSAAAPAAAEITIDITSGHLKPTAIAVPDFIGAEGDAASTGAQIADVVAANLERSSLFQAKDESAFIETITDADKRPRFPDWKAIQTEALVVGKTEINEAGRLQVGFRLWDVTTQSQLLGLKFDTTPDNWRRVAHQISDRIYERLTGEEGYFDTRVVYIDETGPKSDPTMRLAIMDQDSANPKYLTNGSYWVMLPNFSPSSQQIIYVSYRDGPPKTFLFDIETGREERLFNVSAEAESYSARFSPDGGRVVTTVVERGNADVYVYDLRTRGRPQRLTTELSIDTEPDFDPTGEMIVFTSDRSGGGARQLYTMSASGGQPTRISFGEGRYGTPRWSPRGDLIAFTKQNKGRFQLGVMRVDGSGERILTEAYKIDRPTWSPNGRVLMFSSEARGTTIRKELRSIDLTGANERRVPTQASASDPAWSPLLK